MKDKKSTLGSLLLEELKNSGEELGYIYYHLFAIKGDKDLSETLEIYYALSKENPENWFASFHKSMRQTDFFQDCTVSISDPTITDEERKELETLSAIYHKTDRHLSTYEKGLLDALPAPDEPTYKEKYNNYVETYRVKFREHFPQEKINRRRELIKKLRNKEERSISGHLDSILWLTISNDQKGLLYLTIDHLFSEYDYLKKHKLV